MVRKRLGIDPHPLEQPEAKNEGSASSASMTLKEKLMTKSFHSGLLAFVGGGQMAFSLAAA
ncbi:hypothetical protein [Variovorax sp. EBFNA2]|uniref:hypothetical protein n=1 Tax=Variovorax sp. EBFNA2 TaxID=3342097 RepID=UPI0029BFB2D8|nr:hypothetical protein [Variovorax boronicumulans]WPG41181.1 hypothetical protein RZE79_34410 [Variovorax boronicumulans]